MCAQQVIWIFYSNWTVGEQRIIAPFIILTWAYRRRRGIMLLEGTQRTILPTGLCEFFCIIASSIMRRSEQIRKNACCHLCTTTSGGTTNLKNLKYWEAGTWWMSERLFNLVLSTNYSQQRFRDQITKSLMISMTRNLHHLVISFLISEVWTGARFHLIPIKHFHCVEQTETPQTLKSWNSNRRHYLTQVAN